MPKLDLSTLTRRFGSIYPGKLDATMDGRSSLRLGDAGGLSQFGVNLVRIEPQGMSSLRRSRRLCGQRPARGRARVWSKSQP